MVGTNHWWVPTTGGYQPWLVPTTHGYQLIKANINIFSKRQHKTDKTFNSMLVITKVSTNHGWYQPLVGTNLLKSTLTNSLTCCHLNRQHETDKTFNPMLVITKVSTNHWWVPTTGGYQPQVGTN